MTSFKSEIEEHLQPSKFAGRVWLLPDDETPSERSLGVSDNEKGVFRGTSPLSGAAAVGTALDLTVMAQGDFAVARPPASIIAAKEEYARAKEQFFRKSPTDAAHALAADILDARKWKQKLVDACLPLLARGMGEAAWAEVMLTGAEVMLTGAEVMLTGAEAAKTKATTATQWLSQTGITPPPGIVTEWPPWLIKAIEEQVAAAFDEPYWEEIVDVTTRDDIERIIAKGLADGHSIRELADDIRGSLGSEYYHNRAKNIAVTESANALNGGRKAGIDALAEELGPEVPLRAVWLSVLGDTTRDAHANLDGVPADDEGLWDLNGVRIPWPGHYSLPPGDRCNCYCTVISEFINDAEAAAELAEYRQRLADYAEGAGEFAEDKAFCPTGPGGGIDNSCSPNRTDSGKLKAAWQKTLFHTTSDEAASRIRQTGFLPSGGAFGYGVYLTPDKEDTPATAGGGVQLSVRVNVTETLDFDLNGSQSEWDKQPDYVKWKEITGNSSSKEATDKLVAAGYDGLSVRFGVSTQYMLVFDPKNIVLEEGPDEKAFCPTGPGGGIDNSCPPKKAGSGSGIDTSGYDPNNSVAQWARKKIAEMEKLAAAGEWGKLAEIGQQIEQNPPAWATYKSDVAQAWKNLISQKDQQVQSPPADAVPKADDPGVLSGTGWTQISGKMGTEEGGIFLGPDGNKYYVKQPADPDRARNEVLAAKLYAAAGADVRETHLLEIDGKLSVASRWIEADKIDWNNPDMKALAAKDFAIHAWAANWDAIGAGSENPMDNIRLTPDGKLVAIDVGGALDYKGMGGSGKKPAGEFGPEANEWDTMRNASINPSAAKVFGGMTPEQLANSASKLKNLSATTIDELVTKYGGGTDTDRAILFGKLMARRDNILAKAAALQTPVTAPPQNATPPSIPAPPTINSKTNQHAQKKLDEIYAAAQTGNIAAVEAIPTNPTSKQTYVVKQHKYKQQVLAAMKGGGQPDPTHVAPPKSKPAAPPKIDTSTFQAKPEFVSKNLANVAQNKAVVDLAWSHAERGDIDALKAMPLPPSEKLQNWHAQLVSNLADQLNPPPPPPKLSQKYLALANIGEGAVPKPRHQSDAGYWTKLGSINGLPSGLPKGKWQTYGNAALWDSGKAAYDKMTTAEKQELAQHKSSPYTSDAMRNGKLTAAGKALIEAFKKAPEIPPGLLLSRKYTDYNTDYKKLKVGDIISEPGAMSTSTNKEVWSGNVKMEITVGHGVKAMPSKHYGGHDTELEVTMAPAQRILITDIKIKSSDVAIEGVALPYHETKYEQGSGYIIQ